MFLVINFFKYFKNFPMAKNEIKFFDKANLEQRLAILSFLKERHNHAVLLYFFKEHLVFFFFFYPEYDKGRDRCFILDAEDRLYFQGQITDVDLEKGEVSLVEKRYRSGDAELYDDSSYEIWDPKKIITVPVEYISALCPLKL